MNDPPPGADGFINGTGPKIIRRPRRPYMATCDGGHETLFSGRGRPGREIPAGRRRRSARHIWLAPAAADPPPPSLLRGRPPSDFCLHFYFYARSSRGYFRWPDMGTTSAPVGGAPARVCSFSFFFFFFWGEGKTRDSRLRFDAFINGTCNTVAGKCLWNLQCVLEQFFTAEKKNTFYRYCTERIGFFRLYRYTPGKSVENL